MSGPSRRVLLGAALSLALAGAATAAPVQEKKIDAAQLFKYLDIYLKIPTAERSHFVLAYYLSAAGKPVTGVTAWLVVGKSRTPLPIGADGRFERLPTLQALKDHDAVVFDTPPSTKFGLSMNVEPVVRPATEVDARQLALSLTEAQVGVKKAGGMLGFMIPNMERVWITGSQGAEVIFADGHSARLPVVKGMAVFDPAAQPGAKTLRFSQAPKRMAIGPAK